MDACVPHACTSLACMHGAYMYHHMGPSIHVPSMHGCHLPPARDGLGDVRVEEAEIVTTLGRLKLLPHRPDAIDLGWWG